MTKKGIERFSVVVMPLDQKVKFVITCVLSDSERTEVDSTLFLIGKVCMAKKLLSSCQLVVVCGTPHRDSLSLYSLTVFMLNS